MTRLTTLIVCLSLLSACIVLPGESYSPVEQAALRTESRDTRETIEHLELLLAARGFRSEGIYLESESATEVNRSYKGPSNSLATLRAKNGCVSFVTLVKKGTQDFIAPRSLFNEVLEKLSQDGSWEIKRDQVC